ncbi:class D beta-lactamase [Nostocaceae cyanobacterium CENA357]|uniref:Beta-lactamase n=1 Tax=Atlanticothrix silvestris CENA357 TaxID=1725252 RepID=A0A8J7L4P3_9CYAN|nr:class D beta-lactamase [Atlanticothrix silvestris]MBH8555204.1 class D beta-lactamase [Atlanticothrix silvestris CENA357]
MNRIVRFKIIVLVVLSCIISIVFETMQSASMPTSAIELPNRVNTAQNTDFGRHFRELGVEGSILIYDLNRDRFFQHNPQRNVTAFLPASTFKILNSLIALETGVISDEIAVLTWDGIQRSIPEWNRDLNMREAFKLSAVWFYQVIARRVGHERMQKWVAQAGYGNQKIGNKDDIDKFWLEGELRITPQEQIQFLRRLYNNDLPFSKRSLSIVKDIMVMEQTPDYTIRGKTGWVGFTDNVKPEIGWYVGYLEKGKNVYFFSTNIDIRNQKDQSARIELTRRCFKDLAVL